MPELSFTVKLLLSVALAVVISFAATPLVKRMAYKVGAIDVPKDNRRMHKVPIPRLGGLAIYIAFLFTVLVFGNMDRQMQGVLLGSVMIVVLGVLDDIVALKALPKFLVQIAAAGIAVYHGCTIQVQSQRVQRHALFRSWLAVCARDNHLDRCHYQRCQLH